MILYENTVANFRKDIDNRTLMKYIISEYEYAMKETVDPLLKARWKYMMVILGELVYFGTEINDDCGIRLDFYDGADRQDVVLILASGSDSVSNVLVVDLIPWEEVRMCDEEDMVWYDEGIGEGEQKTVHPSFQLAATSLILSAGLEDDSLNIKNMALLYDCEYTRDRDIVSHYKKELTEQFPVYYINQLDKVTGYVKEIISAGNGKDVLRRIRLIGSGGGRNSNLMYPEQKKIFSTVRNYLTDDEVAWFIIKNPSGTGGSTLLNEIHREAENLNKEIVLIDKDETAVPEEFPADRVVVWLYDDYEDEELIQKAKEIAEEKKIYVHNLKLDEAVGLSDGGKGLNWIRRYLNMGTDRKLEWDPEQYTIVITDTAEELPDRKGYASVIIKSNIYMDPETGEICGSKAAMKAVYRRISKGRKGVYIYAEDPVLREYLKKGVQDAENKYSWLKEYISYYEMNEEQLQEAQTGALKNETVHGKYARQAIKYMGQPAWDKLDDQSKNWIVSGLLAYHDMKKYDQLLDFSGVVISICKAVETEIGRRFFGRYREYLIGKYGNDAADRAPFAMTEERRGGGRRAFLNDKAFGLGKMPAITGIGKDGKISAYAWNEFSAYCTDELLIDPERSRETIEEHIEYTEKIRLDYRNQAAHGKSMDVVQAKDCIDYVVGIMHKLGIMLDAYRF